MARHLERDLEKLQSLVLSMASHVEESLGLALLALLEHDRDRARQAIASDAQIDVMENDVQDECLKLLALHQPVAVDLRRIGVVMLISTDLERMGDLATSIAERVLALAEMPSVPVPERVKAMSVRVKAMVRRSLDAFVTSDAALARNVIRTDDVVDSDNRDIIQEIIAMMKLSPEHIEPGISLFSAVRHLERIADHAAAIAEDVIYLVEGEIVRHKPERR